MSRAHWQRQRGTENDRFQPRDPELHLVELLHWAPMSLVQRSTPWLDSASRRGALNGLKPAIRSRQLMGRKQFCSS